MDMGSEYRLNFDSDIAGDATSVMKLETSPKGWPDVIKEVQQTETITAGGICIRSV